MDDFKKRPDENERQYIWRIGQMVDSGRIENWKSIASVLNQELRNDESEYRDDVSYSLYIHFNKINHKKYIGITSLSVVQRWHTDGSGYKNQRLFYRAISKYGWNNFEHVVIFNKLSPEKAYELEQLFIDALNTNRKDCGYNISRGGENISLGAYNIESMSTPVYQYTIEGEFVTEYPSMMEAQRQTGISNSNICACCKGKHAYINNYRWSYNKYDRLDPLNINQYVYDHVTKASIKTVYQYDSELCLINIFNSATEASKLTNTNLKNLSACCLGKRKHANDFVWSYTYLLNTKKRVGSI